MTDEAERSFGRMPGGARTSRFGDSVAGPDVPSAATARWWTEVRRLDVTVSPRRLEGTLGDHRAIFPVRPAVAGDRRARAAHFARLASQLPESVEHIRLQGFHDGAGRAPDRPIHAIRLCLRCGVRGHYGIRRLAPIHRRAPRPVLAHLVVRPSD